MEFSTLDRYIGCLVGGAVGDALGAPVEFMNLADIRERFGKAGIRDYVAAYGRRGAVTDDTQMTLFIAEGLILSHVRGGPDGEDMPNYVYAAYLRWLATQNVVDSRRLIDRHGTCAVVDGILGGYRELHSRRAPGNTRNRGIPGPGLGGGRGTGHRCVLCPGLQP